MDTTTVIITMLVAFITAVFGPILVTWLKVRWERGDSKTEIEEAVEFNTKIDSQLRYIMDEIGCDRVWVAQFHNGGHFYPTGKSIQKFSIFFERVTPDASSIKETFQNIPISLFPKVLCKLYRGGEIKLHSNSSNGSIDLNQFPSEYGTKSLYMLPIDDLDGNFVGLLAVEYTKEECQLNQENINYLRSKVGVIGSLMTKYMEKLK